MFKGPGSMKEMNNMVDLKKTNSARIQKHGRVNLLLVFHYEQSNFRQLSSTKSKDPKFS